LKAGEGSIVPPESQSSHHKMGTCGEKLFENAGIGRPMALMAYKVISESASHKAERY